MQDNNFEISIDFEDIERVIDEMGIIFEPNPFENEIADEETIYETK